MFHFTKIRCFPADLGFNPGERRDLAGGIRRLDIPALAAPNREAEILRSGPKPLPPQYPARVLLDLGDHFHRHRLDLLVGERRIGWL